MQVVLNIPDRYFLDISVGDLVQRLKLSTALLMFQSGQLSAGAACEFAEIDRHTFFDACQQHGINAIDYDPDELEVEFQMLRKGKVAIDPERRQKKPVDRLREITRQYNSLDEPDINTTSIYSQRTQDYGR